MFGLPPHERVAANGNRVRRIARLSGAVGLAALTLATSVGQNPAQAEGPNLYQSSSIYLAESQPLQDVGVTSGEIWVPNLQIARERAQEIASDGADAVRIFEPYSPGQHEIIHDRQRLCNAAEAARENGLKLIISFVGHGPDGVAFIPSRPGQVSDFIATENIIMTDLTGPNANQTGSDGPACVEEPLKEIIIEPFNEVNSTTFNAGKDPAKNYAYLMSRVYPALYKQIDNINQALSTSTAAIDKSPVKLTVLLGGLANHDPLGFLKAFFADLSLYGVNTAPFDVISFHPYPQNPLNNPADVEAYFYPKIESLVKQNYGTYMPLIYDEFGTYTKIPRNKQRLYSKKSLYEPAVSDAVQARYYHAAFATAALQKYVIGAMTFQNRDDGQKEPAGSRYVDGTPKLSWAANKDTFTTALDGTITYSTK